MTEIWKDIKGYEGKYQISNLGNVKSFRQSTKFHKQSAYLLKSTLSSNGYYDVTLYSDTSRHKFLVHRLVAEHFIDNPNNYPCVNHKDENRLNNNVNNLEWCTYEYNNAYGTARIRSIQTKSIPIQQFTLDGQWLATYQSATIASQLLGISKTSITDCCRGKEPYAHGYAWKYQGDQ